MSVVDDLATLGLGPSADSASIRDAYRSLAMDNHPDRGGDTTVMAAITEAYQRLNHPASAPRATATASSSAVSAEDVPDDFTIGHSVLAFVVVPFIVVIILMFGVLSVLSTIL